MSKFEVVKKRCGNCRHSQFIPPTYALWCFKNLKRKVVSSNDVCEDWG